nr:MULTISPECIES: peptidoglycan DD-metalloendopeptidase family protein [unclassified Streptomyces]
MQAQVGNVGLSIGQQIGQQIANRITSALRDAIRDGVNQGGRTARPGAVRQGDETAGAFSRAMKVHLQAAFRSLPKLQIGADTSEADSDLQALRFRMETLADKRIGIDITAAEAKAEIRAIEAELTRLGAKHPNVQVRADTATALTQLAAVRAAIAAVDGKRININTNVSAAQATAALFGLTVALGSVAAIPAIPILAAGLGAIASAAVAAGAGVGALAAVAIPAFVGMAKVLQAQKAAQDAATTASIKGGQANGQGASKALQMAGAQQALATAHRNAARQVSQAEQAVADAVRSSAEANRQASQQVRAAKQALADAVQQAADRQRDAAERVAQAEQSLADAQRTARQAQQDLTQARRDAVAELAELSNRLTDAQLSERDAALSVQEARNRLLATQAAGSKATLLEQQRAQLAYDQAVQRLKEQREETKQLAGEKKAADAAGVEGSETVRSAQERLRDAERGVAEQQKALSKSRTEAARQQVQGQRDIAEAQEKVAESQRNVTRVQEDGARSVARAQESLVAAQQSAADSIASAQRQVASASQSAAGGVDQAAVAQAKYKAALDKLSPSARRTFDAFIDLKSAFGDWSKSLQPQVMPIFTRALIGLKNSLPGITPFVRAAADAIGELQDRASRGFKSEGWKEFKTDLAGAVRPAIIGLGVAFGNLFKGLGGIVQAFLPHMDSISATMQRITGRFAAWGTGLKGSPAFERFLAYSASQGPIVAAAIGDISSAFYQVARALEPLSGPILQILGALARGLASIATTLPWLIQGMYLAYIATKLWTIAMFLLNFVMKANPIVLVGLAIVALVAAVVYAYKHFSWFRQGVQAAWSGIQTAASVAWNSFLKPTFDGIVAGAQTVGRWALWLWRTGIKPAFDGISLGARILAAVIITLLVAPIVIAFRLAGAAGAWLWRVALGPAFRSIGGAARSLYNAAIRPAFTGIATVAGWLYRSAIRPMGNGIVASFRFVGRIGKWLYENAIRPAFRGIGSVASWLWRSSIKPTFGWIADRASWLYTKGLKPAFDKIKTAVRLVGDAFDSARKAIGTAFGKIKSITKEPVNFVIKWVYTKGIKAVWDKVAKFVGLGKLPDAPKLLAAGGTVGNGFGPAAPMKVNKPTAIVGEGNRCIARGTEVHTAAGPQPIEDIQAGEQVLTRHGYRLVKWSGPTRPNAEVLRLVTASGHRVVCTPDHLIWTARGGNSGDGSGDCLGRRVVRGGGLLPDHQDALRHTGSVDASEHDGSRHGGAVSEHRGLKSSLGTHDSRDWPEADVRRGRVRAEERQAADNCLPALAGCTPHSEGAGTAGVDRGTGRRCGVPKALLQARTSVDAGERVYESARHSGVPSVQEGRWPRVDAPEAGEQPGVSRAGEGEGPGVSAPEACWREARELIPGDWVWVLVGVDLCAVRVAAIAPAERTDTFDLTVDSEHEFVAGGILVHNSYPEFVIPTDPKYRGRARSLWEAAGTKLMARGGVLGPIGDAWDWTKDTVSDVVGKGIDWAKTGADLIANPSKIWSKLVKPILSKVTKGVGTAPMGTAIAKFPLKMVSGLKNKIVEAVSSMFAGGGGGEWLKPVNAKYGTRFGVRGSMWSSGRHTGLDFPAATGTPIRAVSDGTVSQVASGGPYGKHVAINHGGGLSSFYAHMSAILTKLHKHVNRGTTIGEVGATGNTTGPHLHLEARRNGRAVDPMPFLTGGGGKGFPSAAVGAAQQYAKSILHRYGWGPSQFGPLKKLWEGESNWRWDALNRSSGAYGIPQSLPASKMRSAGADYLTNYKTQIRWGLGYIKGRPDYGSPARAYSKWLSRSPHWYDQGGYLQPGLNLAYNGTGRPEPVFTQAQASALTRIATSASAGGGGEFTGTLTLDSGEFLGHVRGEVQQTFTALTTTVRAGRR